MMPTKPERAAFAVEEAAKLGISSSLAWRMVREAAIRSIRAGHRAIVPVSATNEYLADNSAGAR